MSAEMKEEKKLLIGPLEASLFKQKRKSKKQLLFPSSL